MLFVYALNYRSFPVDWKLLEGSFWSFHHSTQDRCISVSMGHTLFNGSHTSEIMYLDKHNLRSRWNFQGSKSMNFIKGQLLVSEMLRVLIPATFPTSFCGWKWWQKEWLFHSAHNCDSLPVTQGEDKDVSAPSGYFLFHTASAKRHWCFSVLLATTLFGNFKCIMQFNSHPNTPSYSVTQQFPKDIKSRNRSPRADIDYHHFSS